MAAPSPPPHAASWKSPPTAAPRRNCGPGYRRTCSRACWSPFAARRWTGSAWPASGLSGRRPRGRRRQGCAGSGRHHRGACGSGAPPGSVADPDRPPLAGACAADLPVASERGLHPLRPRAGGAKRGLCRLLKLPRAQTRVAGPPAELAGRVAPPQQFGYDLIVWVGRTSWPTVPSRCCATVSCGL